MSHTSSEGIQIERREKALREVTERPAFHMSDRSMRRSTWSQVSSQSHDVSEGF